MKKTTVIGVDIYNFSITWDVGRCLSSPGGGLNEHIPVVILVIDEDTDREEIF